MEDVLGDEREASRRGLLGGGDTLPFSSSSEDSSAASTACKDSVLQNSEILKAGSSKGIFLILFAQFLLLL
jgi:hypothetical protein